MGPITPKGVVLLADVLPSFLVKLTAPYYIHVIPYSIRVGICAALSAGGMLVVALSGDEGSAGSSGGVWLKILGIALASLSSGGGELSFLGLTHFYRQASQQGGGGANLSLAAWSSGTGAAGLVGAGTYVLATTTFGWSERGTLLVSAVLPVAMVWAYFGVLPRRGGVGVVETGEYQRVASGDQNEEDEGEGLDGEHQGSSSDTDGERDNLRRTPSTPVFKRPFSASTMSSVRRAWPHFKANLYRARGLFFP